LIEQRTLEIGWYEVPVMARRHLHRPLARDAMADVR
jgi:tRNA(Ile2) C34 agmatinyltransferase TiaS